WMIDRQGNPLTDPNRADDGFLLPIGGYKGAALALMFGLLAGTLNGAAKGADVVDFNKDDTTPTNTGQAICVLDIKAFAEPLAFQAPGRRGDPAIARLGIAARLRPYPPAGRGALPPHRGAPRPRHPDPAGIARRPRPHGSGFKDNTVVRLASASRPSPGPTPADSAVPRPGESA